MYEFTKVFKDTSPSDRINNLPERCNEALFKKTKLSMKENKVVMKALGSN